MVLYVLKTLLDSDVSYWYIVGLLVVYCTMYLVGYSLKKQLTKFSSANFQKKYVKSKLYYIENSKTRAKAV